MYRAFWDTIFLLIGSLFTYGQVQENSTSTAATATTAATTTTTTATTVSFTTTTSTTTAVRKFIAAAVHSHFADCPDSHSQFCFHGTCRFLIVEETPACVCHPGFMGMRCEHADLLAVVATNHKQQTVATMLVLCVVASVLLMLLCTLLNGLIGVLSCTLGVVIISILLPETPILELTISSSRLTRLTKESSYTEYYRKEEELKAYQQDVGISISSANNICMVHLVCLDHIS